ncbi:MAG: formylglycine-generating enzyme family protein [Janthinobacterium lividum]
MKRLLFLLVLLLAARGGWAQQATAYQDLIRLVETPGAVFVQDSLFMDEAEVANLHWLEYLHLLRQDSTEAQYQAAKPDTAAWEQLSANDPYTRYYLRYPGFRYFPVVGVSYAQAVRYCRWRSALVNQRMHSAEYLRKHPKLKKYDFRLEYRLPTSREWELAAAGRLAPAAQPYGQLYPPVPGSQRYRKQLVPKAAATACHQQMDPSWADAAVFHMDFNVREHYYAGTPRQAFNCPALPQPLGSLNDGTAITGYIYAYAPNDYGLYNMIGNVAELTATPGVAKGGSFWHSTKDFTLETSFPYAQPQMWLGFRCACTVHIRPKAAE